MKLVLETSVAIGFLVATAVSAREILLSPVYQGAMAGSQAIATVQARPALRSAPVKFPCLQKPDSRS
jgi:hypothetical protein